MKLLVALALVAIVGVAVEARPARDLKSDLITKGNDLVKKAEDAVTKLTTDKKDHEAQVIKTQEEHLKKLVVDLQAATVETRVRLLEHELTLLENRLTHELARINGTPAQPTNPVNPPTNPVTRDLKDTLTTRGNTLVKQAEDAITKLTAEKKDHEVTIIKAEETKIKQLVADLAAATEEAKIRLIEHELALLEGRLQHELIRINHPINRVDPPVHILPVGPVVTRDLKSDLITKGNDLVKKAEDAVTKLTTDKKDHEAQVIKTQEEHLKKLVADLTAATVETRVRLLEHELTLLENRLSHELARINGTPAQPQNPPVPVVDRDLKSDLITKGNDLVKKAEEAVTKLTTDKKDHEAQVIKTQEEHLKKLVADLTAATVETRVRTLEHELTLLENRLTHELARINGTPAQPQNPPTPTNP